MPNLSTGQPVRVQSAFSKNIIVYFRSGWAFLIPYLATYLIYAWFRWPVNPSTGILASGLRPPCLLHLYWFLHAAHLLLGGLALRTWWRESGATPLGGNRSLEIVYPLLPWILLGLLFYIPGIYLEWPSDPWEHLWRINEWHALDTVSAHSSWLKSSYFIPYSLLSWATGLQQIFWLDFYYTGICLLLCWQYYRLARAVGLGEGASMVFVILQALLFGNNIFSFYRYYGISSSIYAQLGAVALTRIALEAAKSPQLSLRLFFSRPPRGNNASPADPPPNVYRLLLTGSLLLSLTAYNHVQGLGIAGLGIMAVVVWRLIEWKRAMVGWLALAVLTLSAFAILWFSRHPALDEIYRPQHWLTMWYGFNLFSPESPAFERSLHILGIFGICNLVAGIVLATRNHPAGWLTLSAPLMLIVPFTAIPFANFLIKQDTILTFHRMLLAVPSGLAVTCVLSSSARFLTGVRMQTAIIATFGIVALQTAHPANNRFWNLIAPPPSDLTYRATIEAYDPGDLPAKHTSLVCTEPTAFILKATYHAPAKAASRTIGAIPVHSIAQVLGAPAVVQPLKIRERLSPNASDWTTVSETSPEFVAGEGNLATGSAVAQNGNGQATEIVTKDAFPVDCNRSYQVEMSMRTSTGIDGTAYLAIVWYDDTGLLLDAATPAPKGAGDPSGWRNGTYSYFGLVGEVPPSQWHTYRISFGSHEERAIPANAAYARMGALLNANGSRSAIIQLSRARLWEKSDAIPVSDGTFAEGDSLIVFIGNRMNNFSPGSQAGLLSGHWPAQQVAIENGGEPEFAAALDSTSVIQKSGGRLIQLSLQGSAPSAGNPHD